MPIYKLVKSPTLGQYITVGAVSQGVAGNWVTRNGQPPTVIDLRTVGAIMQKLAELPTFDWNRYWGFLQNPQPKNTDFTPFFEHFDQCAVWLWGSFDDGGVAVLNMGDPVYGNPTYYGVVLCRGCYENATQKWYNCTGSSYHRLKSNEEEWVFYYPYRDFDETQHSDDNGYFISFLHSTNDGMAHYNALWIGTTPTYPQVDTVYNLIYLDNGGFRQSPTNGNWYPNSGIGYASLLNFKQYDDAMIDPPTAQGWTHVSGTIFSGVVHKDPYAGGNGDQGGGALLDEAQDGVQPPDITDAGILGTGILTLFNPSVQDMTNFANFLYSTLTSGDADALKKLFMNPMDYIICLNMTRLDVSSQTSGSQVVHMGGIDTSVTMPKIVNQFVTYSGGSVTIKPQYNFTDYSPYTKLQIYIPYCGQHELPIDLLQGGTLYLTYNVDLLSGALTAILSVSRNRKEYMFNVENAIDNYTTLTYTGNIYCAVPIGSVDNRQYVSSLIGMASSALTSVASGNPLPLVGMAANAAMASKQTVSHNGAIGSTMGFLANQEAFLIRSRPAVNVPDNYSMWKGYPSNRFGAIKDFTEFVKVDSNTLWTDKFSKDITETECLELKQIVNDGIYIPV